jgi:two-component system, LytTR family, response regulator
MHNRQIRAIIVDDEEKAINNLETLLKNFPQVQIIDKSTDPEKALGKILFHKPDLLFMDIEMPGKTGFEIVTEVYRCGLKPDIIFVTAYDRFAITAIRYAAFDYLLKPVSHEELKNALDRLMEKTNETDKDDQIKMLIEKTSKHKIKFANAGGFILINPEDIIYIEADWNYSDIYLSKDIKEVVSMNIGSVEELLPKEDFFRINRSIIINVNYLARVIRKKLTAVLIKEGQEYLFKIPILKIRGLERFMSK